MINPFTCKECGHVQDFKVINSKSKWDSKLRCMVTLNPETDEWEPPKDKVCENCGSNKMEKDLTKVNIDSTNELRDPTNPRFWKNGKSVSQITDVLDNKTKPY